MKQKAPNIFSLLTPSLSYEGSAAMTDISPHPISAADRAKVPSRHELPAPCCPICGDQLGNTVFLMLLGWSDRRRTPLRIELWCEKADEAHKDPPRSRWYPMTAEDWPRVVHHVLTKPLTPEERGRIMAELGQWFASCKHPAGLRY
jgi:hypothetical protein